MSLKNIEQNPNGEEKKYSKIGKEQGKTRQAIFVGKIIYNRIKSRTCRRKPKKKTLRKKSNFQEKYKLTRGYKKKTGHQFWNNTLSKDGCNTIRVYVHDLVNHSA